MSQKIMKFSLLWFDQLEEMNQLLLKLVQTGESPYGSKDFEKILLQSPSEIAQEIRIKARTPEGTSWTLNLLHLMAQDEVSKHKASEVISIFEKNIPDYPLLCNLIEQSKTPMNLSENMLFESLTEILYLSEKPFDRLGTRILFNRENITEKEFEKTVKLIGKKKPVPLNIILAIDEMEPQKAAKWLNKIVNIKNLQEEQLHAFLSELKNSETLPHVCSELIKQGHVQTLEKIFQSKPEWLGYLAIGTDFVIFRGFLAKISLSNEKINFEKILTTIVYFSSDRFIDFWKTFPHILRKNIILYAGILPQQIVEKIIKDANEEVLTNLINSKNLPIERKIQLINENFIDFYRFFDLADKETLKELLETDPNMFAKIMNNPNLVKDDQFSYSEDGYDRPYLRQWFKENSVKKADYSLFCYLNEKFFSRALTSSMTYDLINKIIHLLPPKTSAYFLRSHVFSIQRNNGYVRDYYSHEENIKQVMGCLLKYPSLGLEDTQTAYDKVGQIIESLLNMNCGLILKLNDAVLIDFIGEKKLKFFKEKFKS